MHDHTLVSLVCIFAIAAATPIIVDLPRRVRVPAVVLEIVLGIAVGPHGLGWAHTDEVVRVLAEFGLAFLIFLAGYEIDPPAMRGTPIRRATQAWLMTFALGIAGGLLAARTGFALSALVLGLALTTTALGTLLPIARDAGLLDAPFGVHLLAGGALGEFGPIVAIALVLSTGESWRSVVALVSFVAVAGAVLVLSSRPTPPRLQRLMSVSLHTSGQLVVRLCILVLVALVWLASALGLDVLLGAFAAGMVARYLVRAAHGHDDVHVVESKLEGIGFGFVIPLFFVVTGMKYDLHALTSSPSAMLRVPLFLALFLVVRGAPILLTYRTTLDARSTRALAIMTSAALPLVVVITDIGLATNRMRPGNAAALVGAAMLSVLIFPIVGLRIVPTATPEAVRPPSREAGS